MQTDVRTLLRLIWGALLTSTVIYVILASVLVQRPDNNLNRGLFSNPVIPVLFAVGVMMFAGSFVIPKFLLRKQVTIERQSAESVTQQLRTFLVVKYALLEACSVLGLAAAFIGREWQLILPMWALSVAGFLLAYPSDAFVNRLAEK